MTQGWIALAVAAILIISGTPVLGQSGRPQIIVNGSPVKSSEPPQVVRGVIVAPLRPLAAAFGASVAWDDDAPEGVVTSRPGVAVRLAVGEAAAAIGTVRVALPVAPFRRGRTVWVPVAALLRALGAYLRLDTEQVVEAMSQVTGIVWRRSGDGIVVRVATTGPVTTRSLVLTDPDRVAVDVMQAAAALEQSRIEVNDADVTAIRAAQFSTRPYITRIVLDLTHPVPYTVAIDQSGVVVTASPQLAAPVPPPAPPSPPPAPVPPPAAAQNEPEHPNGAAPEPRALPPLPEFSDGPNAFHVQGVRYVLQDGQGRLIIATSQPVKPAIRQFAYPDRLAIDLPGGVFISRRQDLEVGSALIRNVVVEQLQLEPNLVRVIVYLQRKTGYTTSPAEGGRGIVFLLNDQPGAEKVVRTVVIDPGHGGGDSGAIGPTGVREADVTLGIARHAAELLEGHGVRAVLTRTGDTSVALEDRTDLARRERALAFVSIHANASQIPGRRGTETYYGSSESQTLAALIHSEIVRVLKGPDRRIRAADFYVIVNIPAPAILVETGFISNPIDEGLLRDAAVQRRIAEAIVRGLMKYLGTRNAAAAP